MILKMMQFEWRYFTKQPSFIVTCLIFFLLPFLSITIDNVQIGASSNVNINSPYAIAQTLLIFAIFGMFLVVNFVANTAMRNEASGMNEIIVTKPLQAFQYQLGRFLGAYAVCLTVFAMIPLALMIGSLMPWLDQERVGAFALSYYLKPYFIFSVTTLFVLSALFYAFALRFQSMMAVYLIALGIFILYVITGEVFSSPSDRELAALLDPFGLRTFAEVTRYWTPAERNFDTLGLSGEVLYNRLLWLAVGFVIFMGFSRLFSPLGIVKKRSASKQVSSTFEPPLDNDISAKYSNDSALAQFTQRLKFEMQQVFLSPAFLILMVYCFFTLIFILADSPGIYGAPNWPLTQYMVEMINGAFSLVIIIIITYYSAEVVWRERSVGMGDIVDSMPVSNLTFWLTKFLAVSCVIVAVLLSGMLATILFQLSKGFVDIDLSQYAISLGYFSALQWILLVVLAFFIQALSPNKYVGMLIFVAYFFVSLAFTQIGLEHNMFQYGNAPVMQYSDMNGYGWALTTQNYYMLYWGALALVLAALSYALWQRGPQNSLKSRFALLGYQLGSGGRSLVIIATLVFIGVGTIIHYNTTVINEFVGSEDGLDLRADYEKTYAQYEDAPVPIVESMHIDVAIFPELRQIEAIANFEMRNQSDAPIEKALINLPRYTSDLRIDIEGARVQDVDEKFDTAWLVFETPLPPQQQVSGKISLSRQHFGFKDAGEDTTLVQNGTFINNFELLPNFGVNTSVYLDDRHERRKRDLPPPKRAYDLEDTSRYTESFFGPTVGLIDFSATLSTSEDQIAIAPGYLQKYWNEDGRNYFHYEMDAPMINFFSIMSADLEVKTAMHNGVEIAIYYHRDHDWNIDRMIEASKDSLDLFQSVFGPYQHRQLRIIEFPGYRRFAQSFANTVPYSERIGFITDLRDKDNIDPVYYITAHEVAHQWFGHQLNAANVQGSAILSESLSQYAALLVMKDKYGQAKMREFLSYELDSYLRGRTQEQLEEMPFMRAEGQQYIHYRKGSIVMMAIADRIGEEALNRALSGLIEKFKFSRDEQATTLDLLAAIKAEAPKGDHAFIEQQFTQITVYDIRLNEVLAEQRDDGKYDITLSIHASQYKADGKGKETPQDFSDVVDIAFFDDDPDDFSSDTTILYQKKHQLEQGENTLVIVLDEKPAYAGVDPFVRFIDRESQDNILKVN
uniref:ABC transporter permease/M1 family aminopeptidase n=1 Tax=Ningiella ruwaisensis TaxID=2364274 RepID=UPI00109F912B|nr:M1 family aminopeptidase [Ningiella ruwaisensis]